MKVRIAIITLFAGAMQSGAEIVLPDIVGDNMVVKQNAEVRMWGWSDSSEPVTVVASWAPDVKLSARPAADSGRWDVLLPTPAASFEPATITVSDSDDVVTIGNVLVGEVWFCSGQSNMEMPLRGFWTQPVEGAVEAVAYSGSYPGIRVAKVPKRLAYEPQDRVESPWKVSAPRNARDFSALAYFFAQSLTRLLNVPVGIIDCSYGGSKVESWQSRAVVDTYPEFDVEAERADSTMNDWYRATAMYNAMLHPLVGYTISGFLWNQGESNVGCHDTYALHLSDMVKQWRDEWNQGELPFYFVEIPGWNYGNPDGIDAALLRESQHHAADIIPSSGIVCTADLVYPFEVNDIHARRKREIGERLAFMAAARTYGIEGTPIEYPKFRSMEAGEGGKAILSFDNAWEGFTPNTELEGFEAAGADGVFHPAHAIENPQTLKIEVTCPEIEKIEVIRYNFKNFAIGKVFNVLGLPLIPFRTDGDK